MAHGTLAAGEGYEDPVLEGKELRGRTMQSDALRSKYRKKDYI